MEGVRKRAFARHSRYSDGASESQVIPPPTPAVALPPARSSVTVRMATENRASIPPRAPEPVRAVGDR